MASAALSSTQLLTHPVGQLERRQAIDLHHGALPLERLREKPLSEMLRCIADEQPAAPTARRGQRVDRDLDG